MMTLGRMYRDSEMPAMMACRVGPSGIYRPLTWLIVPLVLGVAWLSIEGSPWALTAIDRVGAEARREADLASIEPGQFTIFGPDRAVVYGQRVTPEGFMEKVFMQRQVDDGSIEVVISELGEMVESDDPNIRLLVLHDGRRYEGVPGTTEFRVIEFAEHGVPYRLPSLKTPDPKPRAMGFMELLKSDEPEHIAELQWRLSVPLSTIILAILAVPLSRSQPRAGRYGRLAVGLLVFIIYLNMMSAAKAWIEQSSISPTLGIWWVHGCMLLFALGLLAVQNGYHRRLFR
jgi:lipopolysaccharide export system permease protein